MVVGVEVSLGLGRSPEPSVTPPHLDVTSHLVNMTCSSLMDDRFPADAWLTARLGENLELDETEKLLPVPGCGDAKP